MSASSPYADWARAFTDKQLAIDLELLAASIRHYPPERRTALLRETARRIAEPTCRIVNEMTEQNPSRTTCSCGMAWADEPGHDNDTWKLGGHDRMESTYRVISHEHGLVWTGTDAERAEEIAIANAVNTGRRTYLQEGTDN